MTSLGNTASILTLIAGCDDAMAMVLALLLAKRLDGSQVPGCRCRLTVRPFRSVLDFNDRFPYM